MGKMFEYIFEDLTSIKKQQTRQKKFNRRIAILGLAAIVISEIRAFDARVKYGRLSDEFKEYKQSKGE